MVQRNSTVNWEVCKMNNLIRLLAKQADGVFIHKLITGAKQYTFLEKDLEKFAELIVRECRTVINDVYHKTPLELCGPLLTVDEEIMNHFYGVEKNETIS